MTYLAMKLKIARLGIFAVMVILVSTSPSKAQDRSILGFRITGKATYPTPEESEAGERWENSLRRGDWTPIHKAYTDKDLILLWQMLYRVREGDQLGFSKTDEKAGKVGLSDEAAQAYAREVRVYVHKLLTQIPGHAKVLGDEMDRHPRALAPFNARELRNIGSPEAIQQLARFLDDKRGQATPEEIASIERMFEAARGTDEPIGRGGPVGICYRVVPELHLALGYESPVMDLRNPVQGYVPGSEKVRERLRAWWASPASAKYRNLPQGEPPVEPLPPKIDMKEWLKEFEARPKLQVEYDPNMYDSIVSLKARMSAEEEAAPKPEVKPEQASSKGWNLWLVLGLTLMAVVTTSCLAAKRRM
jgi:hypothetical protein